MTEFKDLIGQTIVSVEKQVNNADDQLIFTMSDNKKYVMGHIRDCCESVWLDDVIGDWEDVTNTPILNAEEVTSHELSDKPLDIHPKKDAYLDESCTWTFYKLMTAKGYVDFRWCGTSNGYYSESVDFYQVEDK